MMPVTMAKKPATFDEKVRKPGLRAISEMVGQTPKFPRTGGHPFKKIATAKRDIPSEKFPPYWTEALDDLMSAYNQICAYSGFRIHPVTGSRSADHMIAKSLSWRNVYEWKNYRLACGRLNSRKREFDDVIDPFHVQAGWFELDLVTFNIVPAPGLNNKTTELINLTIERLGLNDFRHYREDYAELYLSREISLRVLRKEAPYIAYELFRQHRLNPGDVY
jgi:hypothetical protein